MSFNKTYAELRQYVSQVTKDQPSLKESDAFAFWFCQASLLHPDEHKAIRQSLTGKSYDKNIDAICFSHVSNDVYVCQTKYRAALRHSLESQNDLNSFARIAAPFSEGTEKKFLKYFPDANADVRKLLAQAWRYVYRQAYNLQLFYVTTGKFSAKGLIEASDIVEATHTGAELIAYDGHDCCRIFESFRSLAPAIPFVTVEGVRTVMRTSDGDTNLKSAVFPAPVKQIQTIFNKHGERLFARNIRLDKGDSSSVNKEIRSSLEVMPERFFYLNNGITILGRDVMIPDAVSGSFAVKIFEPQIINGQQTTRTIGRVSDVSHKGEVLVKVICRRPESDAEIKDFRHFIYSVVRATNSQNAVKVSELASNNPEHIELERAFKRLNWHYIRKVGKSEGTPYWSGQDKPYGEVTLKELAVSLISCEHDPHFIRREGIEALFDAKNASIYSRLFAEKKQAFEYLFCHLVRQLARKNAPTKSKKAKQLAVLGQYYIAHILYRLLRPVFDKNRVDLLDDLSLNLERRRFTDELIAVRNAVASSWTSFYEDQRDEEDDPLSFVSSGATKSAWSDYWNSTRNAHRRKLAQSACATVAESLK